MMFHVKQWKYEEFFLQKIKIKGQWIRKPTNKNKGPNFILSISDLCMLATTGSSM